MGDKSRYLCQGCGFVSPKWLGRCPDCGAWNSLLEEPVAPRGAGARSGTEPAAGPVPLDRVARGGEDKPDSHQEYSGLVDFTSYHQEQARWLESVLASQEFKSSQHQVVLLHIAIFGEDQAPSSFEPVVSLLRANRDIDLMINGHTHVYGIFQPGETGLAYPVAFSGGPEPVTAAAVLVNTESDPLQVQIVDVQGTVIDQIP